MAGAAVAGAVMAAGAGRVVEVVGGAVVVDVVSAVEVGALVAAGAVTAGPAGDGTDVALFPGEPHPGIRAVTSAPANKGPQPGR